MASLRGRRSLVRSPNGRWAVESRSRCATPCERSGSVARVLRHEEPDLDLTAVRPTTTRPLGYSWLRPYREVSAARQPSASDARATRDSRWSATPGWPTGRAGGGEEPHPQCEPVQARRLTASTSVGDSLPERTERSSHVEGSSPDTIRGTERAHTRTRSASASTPQST